MIFQPPCAGQSNLCRSLEGVTFLPGVSPLAICSLCLLDLFCIDTPCWTPSGFNPYPKYPISKPCLSGNGYLMEQSNKLFKLGHTQSLKSSLYFPKPGLVQLSDSSKQVPIRGLQSVYSPTLEPKILLPLYTDSAELSHGLAFTHPVSVCGVFCLFFFAFFFIIKHAHNHQGKAEQGCVKRVSSRPT